MRASSIPSSNAPFIVIESCDGGGSTTLRDRLTARSRASGHESDATEQPSKGPIGTFIREVLRGEREMPSDAAFQRLYVADRIDHVERVIEPARASGRPVFCDRYELSTAIYFAAGAHKTMVTPRLGEAFLWNAELPRPDLTIVLAVSPETAAARRAARRKVADVFEENAAFQQRVARFYESARAMVLHGGAKGYRSSWSETIDDPLKHNSVVVDDANLVVVDGNGAADAIEQVAWLYVEPVLQRWRAAPAEI